MRLRYDQWNLNRKISWEFFLKGGTIPLQLFLPLAAWDADVMAGAGVATLGLT